MRIDIKIDGDLKAMMAAEIRAGERAVSGAMRNAGTALKMAWRQQVLAAKLGTRLANAARSETYPEGRDSLNASALVWSKAPKIYGAFEKGPIIRAQDGFWLAIPKPAAGKGEKGRKITPGEWERKTGRRLRFIFRKGRTALLVDDGTRGPGNAMARKSARGGVYTYSKPVTFRNRSVVMFTLVPQAKLRKTLNLFAAADQAAQMLPAAIVSRWRSTR